VQDVKQQAKETMLKRMAVLSDIHGNIAALEAVVTDFNRRQVEGILNLGDHLSGPLWPRETVQYLMRQDWIHIAGNHDRQLVHQDPKQHGLSDQYAYQFLTDRECDWLRALPATLTLPGEISLFHGTPASNTTYLLETVEHGRGRLATPTEIGLRLGDTRSRVLLCGHTHIPRLVQLPDNTLIVNPGSVGLQAYSDDVPEPHVMGTGSPHARYAILEYQTDNWVVEFVAVSYDYQKAAEQARKNNRPDWEMALQTGFMQDMTGDK
jgi:predicted phosphodiesterase